MYVKINKSLKNIFSIKSYFILLNVRFLDKIRKTQNKKKTFKLKIHFT